MIYDLPLDQPVLSPQILNTEENLKLLERIESIKGFKNKLEFYNSNICSLSTFLMRGKVYFQWGNSNQRLKIYCGCRSCRELSDFSIKKEKIYLALRAKEVNRIIEGLKKITDYRKKLQFIFSVKGYSTEKPPQIYENISFDPVANEDLEIFYSTPSINLTPFSKAEVKIYNEFVKGEFDKRFRTNSGFSNNYKCFDSVKEIERLDKTLEKSIDPHNLLLYCRNIINTFFNYPNCIKEVKESLYANQIEEQINKISLGPYLFAQMILGVEVDLDRIILDESELLRYVHISEIVKFYSYVSEKIQAKYKSNPKAQLPIKGKLLSELAIDNSLYKKFVELYHNKIETASEFISKADFIKDEIERVEKQFIQPLEVKISGDFKMTGQFFDLTKYKKIAFDCLKSGQNFSIDGAINQAKKDFVNYKRSHQRNYSEINNTEEIEEIGNSVIFCLSEGVGLLKYQKFLKEQLEKTEQISIKKKEIKGQLSVKQIALIYAYEGNQITRENASEIAATYGYVSATSGEGLFQDYTAYSSPSFRKAKPSPCTPKKLKNKIHLLEGVTKYLTDKAKKRAEDEIIILKTLFENDFQ